MPARKINGHMLSQCRWRGIEPAFLQRGGTGCTWNAVRADNYPLLFCYSVTAGG